MTRSSISTTAGRISAGSTSGFSPWVLGFRGTDVPVPLLNAIGQGRVSGLILFRDNLGGSLEAAQDLRRRVLAHVPPHRPFLFFMDEEGGLISQTAALALPDGRSWSALPTPRALGRIGSASETRWAGRLIGRRLHTLGVAMDFAPSLDLDLERENPIIGSRAFSSDPERVARLGFAFARGLADAGVGSCFKHFPGHGGTRKDSHLTLPVMEPGERKEHQRPFRACLELAQSKWPEMYGPRLQPWVMSAHVDWGSGRPASLDRSALSPLRKWCAGSLISTDALDMGAVELMEGAAGQALAAGNDVLLIGRDWEAGLEAMHRLDASIRRGKLDQTGRPLLDLLARARRRALPVWSAMDPAAAHLRAPRGSDRLMRVPREDGNRLARIHRLAVRVTVPPPDLPRGGWIWVIPEGFAPYVRLSDWNPPRGRWRYCQEVRWIPEVPTASVIADLAEGLRRVRRPVLVATLFRGRPSDERMELLRPLFEHPRLTLIAHLLDEGWPNWLAGAWERRSAAVALTSGPSPESLTGLAEALDLPARCWSRGPDGLHFPIDSRGPDRVK
jgi:beta-glucosidase-like glycosyl hydrolase